MSISINGTSLSLSGSSNSYNITLTSNTQFTVSWSGQPTIGDQIYCTFDWDSGDVFSFTGNTGTSPCSAFVVDFNGSVSWYSSWQGYYYDDHGGQGNYSGSITVNSSVSLANCSIHYYYNKDDTYAGGTINFKPAVTVGKPTNIQVSKSGTSATVTWNAPSVSGGSGNITYVVTTTGKSVNAGTNRTATVTGLTEGTAYTFRVTATYSGVSNYADSSSVTMPKLTNPSNVTTSRTGTTVKVSWTAAQGTNGSGSVSYTVTPTGKSAISAGTATSLDVTGLTQGSAYTFTVTASYTGLSKTATSGSVTIPKVTAPSNIQLQRTGTSVKVTWSASSGTSGSGNVTYTVTPTGKSAISAGTNLTATATGLTQGSAYTFTVTATYSGVTASATSSSITIPKVTAPTNIAVTKNGTTATVSWGASSGSSGSGNVTYSVTPTGMSAVSAGTNTSVQCTGLTKGGTYTFTVTATYSGVSTSSVSSSVTMPNLTEPRSITLERTDATSVKVSWTAPATATNGSGSVNYTVTATGGSESAQSTALNRTMTGLTKGTTYTFTVKAYYSGLTSTATSASYTLPNNCTSPTVCTIEVTETSATTVNLTCSGAASGTSNRITGYRIERSEYNGSAWSDWATYKDVTVQNYATSFTEAVNTPSTIGNKFKFRVTTMGEAGSDYYSTPPTESSNTVTKVVTLSTPAIQMASSKANACKYTITASTVTGGSGVVSYTVYRNGTSIGDTIISGTPVTVSEATVRSWGTSVGSFTVIATITVNGYTATSEESTPVSFTFRPNTIKYHDGVEFRLARPYYYASVSQNSEPTEVELYRYNGSSWEEIGIA